METKHTLKTAEKQTAKALRLSALETLSRIANLLNEIASEVERLAETEHEAETPAIPTQAEWSAYAKTINQRKKNTP